MNSKEELQRIKEKNESIRKAQEIKEQEYRKRNSEFIERQIRELADVIEDFFIKEQVSEDYFLLKNKLSGGYKLHWLYDDPISRKYNYIYNEACSNGKYFLEEFERRSEELLKERGIGIKTKSKMVNFDVHVWIWIL